MISFKPVMSFPRVLAHFVCRLGGVPQGSTLGRFLKHIYDTLEINLGPVLVLKRQNIRWLCLRGGNKTAAPLVLRSLWNRQNNLTFRVSISKMVNAISEHLLRKRKTIKTVLILGRESAGTRSVPVKEVN